MGVWAWGWWPVFNIHVILVKIHGIIIKRPGFTLHHVIRTLLLQPTKFLLESLSPGELKWACYDDSMMGLASFFFRAAIGLAKAFLNANVIALDRRGRHELQGIVEPSDGRASLVLNGGL